MSDPAIATKETRPHRCERCPRNVKQRKLVGAFAGGQMWSVDPHNAPCGLPCFGAAVPGKAMRLAQIHRNDAECPRCKEWPPGAHPNRDLPICETCDKPIAEVHDHPATEDWLVGDFCWRDYTADKRCPLPGQAPDWKRRAEIAELEVDQLRTRVRELEQVNAPGHADASLDLSWVADSGDPDSVDDLVASNVTTLRLERMDDGLYWLGFEIASRWYNVDISIESRRRAIRSLNRGDLPPAAKR